jgi:hypothetical protein
MKERWAWHRWQLIHVDALEGSVVLDAIELTQGLETEARGPVTLVFDDREVPSAGGATVRELLYRWVHCDDGMCDVFQRLDQPSPVFAMFQGEDVVIASVHDLG